MIGTYEHDGSAPLDNMITGVDFSANAPEDEEETEEGEEEAED